jgi:hypothetical protein
MRLRWMRAVVALAVVAALPLAFGALTGGVAGAQPVSSPGR